MRILVLDKNGCRHPEAKDIALDDIEIGHLLRGELGLMEIQLADFVVIVDHETRRFRVVKDRMTGENSIQPLDMFGQQMQIFVNY